ncbi:MAG: rhodanese-like domain-containing protein [Myxococcota bacterium]
MRSIFSNHIGVTSPVALFAMTLFLLAGCQAEEAGSAIQEISQQALLSSPPKDALILDVRTFAEFTEGHIPDAMHIPHDELAARFPELKADLDRPIVLYCKSGRRAGIAAAILQRAGFVNLHHLTGDMNEWIARGRRLE